MSASSASHPSSADESTVPEWNYDVFLSFRGEDTRKGIISHLHDELQNTGGIKAFKDDEELGVGAPISPSLFRAIEESRFGIVVLSANYADSAWCLDELTHIIQCMGGQDRILPLFYEVDPSHVRKQKGSFGLALCKHEENSMHSQQKVKQWRVALEKVGSLSGWDSRIYRSDRELVKHIVKIVCSKVLQPTVDSQVPEIQRLVSDESRPEELQKNLIKVGPFGTCKGGKPFDDGDFLAVKGFRVCYDEAKILFIQVEYVDLNGNVFWSGKHGDENSSSEKEVETVTLNYPDEYLTSMHGSYVDSWVFKTQILSLTFHSNKRIFGPFGSVRGRLAGIKVTGFSIEETGSKIVGLFGRCGTHIYDFHPRALGAYLKPL